MLKVMTIVGTRPELIKMSRVIAELDLQVEHVLVHSGQNYDYELNQVFLMSWAFEGRIIFSVLLAIQLHKPLHK